MPRTGAVLGKLLRAEEKILNKPLKNTERKGLHSGSFFSGMDEK